MDTQAVSFSSAPKALITQIQAQGSTVVNGTAIGDAQTAYGGKLPTFQASDGTVAYGIASPSAAASTAVLNANGNIKTAFGAAPSFFAMGEVGGGHASAGADSETSTSSIITQINLANLAAPGNLVFGLYNGEAVGNAAGLTGVTLSVTANSVALPGLSVSITSELGGLSIAQQADALFHNMGFGGELALAATGTLVIDVSLSVTTDQAGAGFYGDFIFGDPPTGVSARPGTGFSGANAMAEHHGVLGSW